VAGSRYAVEYRPSLTGGSWTEVDNNIAATGPSTTYVDNNRPRLDAGQGFWRVRGQ